MIAFTDISQHEPSPRREIDHYSFTLHVLYRLIKSLRREGSHMQGLTTELVNAVFMATKLAGDINVYDYRVREFEKICR